MILILRVLAFFGMLAVLARAGRALVSLLGGGMEMFLGRDLGEVRRQRGDLTGMEEAAALRQSGRRRRARAVARLIFWIGLLLVPALTPWPWHLMAAYSVLWLLPGGRTPWRASMDVTVR